MCQCYVLMVGVGLVHAQVAWAGTLLVLNHGTLPEPFRTSQDLWPKILINGFFRFCSGKVLGAVLAFVGKSKLARTQPRYRTNLLHN